MKVVSWAFTVFAAGMVLAAVFVFGGFSRPQSAFGEEGVPDVISDIDRTAPVIPQSMTGASFRWHIEGPTAITVTTSASVKLTPFVPNSLVMFTIAPIGEISASVSVAISGLVSGTTYSLYRDSRQASAALLADGTGTIIFSQDLAAPHFIWLEPMRTGILSAAEPGSVWFISENTVLTEDFVGTIDIVADDVTFDCNQHTIRAMTPTDPYVVAILAIGRNRVTIRNCIVRDFSVYGILSVFSNDVTIADNAVSGGAYGIMSAVGDRIAVTGNEITSFSVAGIDAWLASDLNFAENKPITALADSEGQGIVVSDVTKVRITNNVLSGNYQGFAVWPGSTDVVVSENIIERNGAGGVMYLASGNQIIENKFFDTLERRAISINGSDRTIVRGNRIINRPADTGRAGILVMDAHDNEVSYNVIEGTRYGIGFVGDTSGNRIFNNSISQTRLGVYFDQTRADSIFHNNVFSNRYGAYVEPGLPGVEISAVIDGRHEGNWWGRTSPPCFVPGVDSNRLDVVDSYAYCKQDEWEEPPSPEVPLYTQVRSPYPSDDETKIWADLEYAGGFSETYDCGSLIRHCGCGIASAVMVARFPLYGVTEAQGQDVNPGTINQWLKNEPGGYQNGDVNWIAVAKYTDWRIKYEKTDKLRNNFALLDQKLNNKQPVIAKENAVRGGVDRDHFLVIDGKRGDGSYRVKDPAWYNTNRLDQTTDITNHIRGYDGGFDGLRIFKKGDGIAQSAITFALGSPAELLLTDPLGRKLGKDSAGVEYSEIPDAWYFQDGFDDPTGAVAPSPEKNKLIQVLGPLDGGYQLQIISIGEGDYRLDAAVYDKNGQSTSTVQGGAIALNDIQGFELDYSSESIQQTEIFRIVTIDVKPGSDPNSINLKSKGVIPVAVLTDSSLDARDVVIDSILFAGARSLRSKFEDIDNDGDFDLILHFEMPSLRLDPGDTRAILTAKLKNDISIKGTDTIRLISSQQESALSRLLASIWYFFYSVIRYIPQ